MKFKTDFMNQQWNHQPMNENETRRWLSTVFKYAAISDYKNALDIGTGSGLSAVLIAKGGNGKIDTVDVRGGMGKRLVEDEGFSNRVTFYENGERPDKMYEFISVDGDHCYESVRDDLKYAWEHMEHGYIVCDDYEHPKYVPNVKKAIDEFGKDHPFIVDCGRAIFEK